jgi:hypothetical protein
LQTCRRASSSSWVHSPLLLSNLKDDVILVARTVDGMCVTGLFHLMSSILDQERISAFLSARLKM